MPIPMQKNTNKVIIDPNENLPGKIFNSPQAIDDFHNLSRNWKLSTSHSKSSIGVTPLKIFQGSE